VLGVAGADPGADVVRVAGLAGLVAGAISMAAGEYNSMRVQSELLQRELELERIELERNPHVETVELGQIYASRETALEAHAREELGVDPGALGSPWAAASSSFVAFAIGATVPLVPWFVGGGTAAVLASLILATVTAVVVGVVTARMTTRPVARVVLRQVAFTLIPAAITFAIGSIVGVSV